MKRLEPVIWAKGTFLTPQHLRLQLAIPEYRERGLDVSAPVRNAENVPGDFPNPHLELIILLPQT